VGRQSVLDYIGTEKTIHGRQWNAVHGGYFSDPATARPLVETAAAVLTRSPADVVVDLGGGTGFLLSQLASHGTAAGLAMVNVDCSQAQLDLAAGDGVSTLCASVGDFSRGDVAVPDQRLLYMMRSVLHYLGREGLSPMLRHVRDQAEDGESFVHQTASFDNEEDAACLNSLYSRMHTRKWYPTVSELKGLLARAGWCVVSTTAAPPLLLKSDDLARRYALASDEVDRIRDAMAADFGERDGLFRLTPSGFQANLHYRIYTCMAGSARQ
jgi:SAM-dependent methyltransferase